MKKNRAVALALLVVTSGVLLGGVIDTSTSSVAVQDDEQTDIEIEVIPDQHTALQNESTSLAVQIHNREHSDKFVLVRIFEPHGVNGMRVDGEPPTIPQNNTDMWQSSQTLEPQQRLAVPITIEPGSNPDKHVVRVQVKYFNESSYTGKWETGVLAVEKCSATCRARGAVAVVFEFFVSYRNALIALLSLTVATLSLLLAMRRSPEYS